MNIADTAGCISQFASYLSNFKEIWPAAIGATAGAVGGAILSSYFSYRIQNRSFQQERKLRENEIRRSEQALGRSLLIKLHKIHTNTSAVHRQVAKSFKGNPDWELWQLLRPLTPIPDPIHFTSEELSMLMGLESESTFNSVMFMDVNHDSTLGLIRTYNSERKNLEDKMPTSSVDGNIVESNLDSRQSTELRVLMNRVNDLAIYLHNHVKRYTKECEQTVDELCELFRDKLDLKHRVLRRTDEGAFEPDGPP